MKQKFLSKKKHSNLILSVVALIEIIAIAIVSVSAWVETVSTIKISGNGVIDTYTYTNANIGSGSGYTNIPIDLSTYVRKSGNLHFALASSANGTDFYFPKVASMGTSASSFRKGNINDKNVNYLNFSFDVKAVNADKDFMFASVPTIKVGGTTKTDDSVRIAISDGTTTRIYSNSTKTESVVAASAGTSATASLNAFSNYVTGKNSLFSVTKGATKRITVTIWLQYNATKNANYTGQEISITNFKIVPVDISTDSTVTVSCNTSMGSVTAQSGTTSGTSITVAANSSVTIKATPKDGYKFVAWYKGTSTSGTKVDGAGAEYTFTAGARQTYNYYAEFAKIETITIKFVDGTSNQWIDDASARMFVEDVSDGYWYEMTRSGNTWTASVPATVGNVKFYRRNPEHNANWNTWTNTGTRGSNTTYTATDNEAGYWSITITFKDGTSNQWIDDASARIFVENISDGYWYEMTRSGNTWTVSVPATVGNVKFYRRNPEHNANWNTWTNTGTRGSKTTYTATDNEAGSWS